SDHARVAALEFCWYMRNQLLRDTDWSSMAHSLEVRLPFVDPRVLERLGPAIASSTPPRKHDLAACAGFPHLPQERAKTGFTTRVREWIRRPGESGARGLRGWAMRVADQFDAALDSEGRPAMPPSTRKPRGKNRGLAKPHARAESARSRRETILIFRIGSIG